MVDGVKKDEFKLVQDTVGKFWLWSKTEQMNVAIRATDELDAYKKAADSLLFSAMLYKERRDAAERKLEVLMKAFEEVNGEEV